MVKIDERVREEVLKGLDKDTFGHILQDKRACGDVLVYLEETSPDVLQMLINMWLRTKDGKAWYERRVERLLDDKRDEWES